MCDVANMPPSLYSRFGNDAPLLMAHLNIASTRHLHFCQMLLEWVGQSHCPGRGVKAWLASTAEPSGTRPMLTADTASSEKARKQILLYIFSCMTGLGCPGGLACQRVADYLKRCKRVFSHPAKLRKRYLVLSSKHQPTVIVITYTAGALDVGEQSAGSSQWVSRAAWEIPKPRTSR